MNKHETPEEFRAWAKTITDKLAERLIAAGWGQGGWYGIRLT